MMMVFQHSQFPPEGFSLVLGKPSLDVWVSFVWILTSVSVMHKYKSQSHFTDGKLEKLLDLRTRISHAPGCVFGVGIYDTLAAWCTEIVQE